MNSSLTSKKRPRPAGGDFDPVVVPDDLPPPPVRPVQAPAPAWLAWGLAAVLAFAVFAFGAVEDWSSATVEVALFALAALAAYGGVPGFLKRPVRLGAPALVVALLALAGLLQLVPLKTAWWAAAGDERGTLMQKAAGAEALLHSEAYRTDPVTQAVLPPDGGAQETPPAPAWQPASFTPAATARAVVALLAAGALILLLAPLTNGRRENLRALAWVTGALAVGVGLVALAQFRPGAAKVLGLRESVHAGGAFGPFINENNGMGFVNLGLACLYYLLWRRADRDRRVSNRLGIAMLFLAVLGFHAVLLGIRTSAAGFWPLLLFPACLLLHALRKRKRLALALGAAMAAGLLLLALVSVQGHFTDLHGRLGVWADALAQPHWFAGNGLASFGERFQAVLRDAPARQAVWWVYPENEYLQLVFEAGLAGAAAGLLALGYVLSLGWRSLMAAGHAFVLVPFLWGEALHAATDFHFHLWPVAIAFMVVIALAETSLARLVKNGRPPAGSTAP